MEQNVQDEPKRSLAISILIAVILLLVGVLAYFILIKNNPTVELTNETSTFVEQEEAEEEMELPENKELAVEEAEEETPQEEIEVAIDYSDDIDEDLSKLDELDLSSPENDLGDDKLGDL